MATTPIVPFGNENQISVWEQYRTSELREKEDSDYLHDLSLGIAKGATLAGGAYYAYKKLNQNVSFDKDNPYFTFLKLSAKYSNKDISGSRFTFGDSIVEMVRKFEEYSPAQMMRTFSLSHLIAPYLGNKNIEMQITGEEVKRSSEYWKNLLKREGNREIDIKDLSKGFVFKNGSLYEAGEDGSADLSKKILNNARVVHTYYEVPGAPNEKPLHYRNRVFEKVQNIYGLHRKDYVKDPITIMGSKGRMDPINEIIRPYFRLSVERGARIFDQPLEATMDFVKGNFSWTEFEEKNFKGHWYSLGTQGNYDLGARETLLKMGKNVAKKMAIGAFAYAALDYGTRQIVPEENAFSQGILPGLSTAYVNARVGLAENVFDKTQGLREAQEEIAPSSTDLSTLAGIPASLMVGGMMASWFTKLGQGNIGDYEAVQQANLEHKPIIPGRSVSSGIFKDAPRTRRWGARGGLIGAALMAPFALGALVTGESSEELREVYSGEKEVAIRSSRFWGGGGYAWEGAQIKYFAPHWYPTMMADVKTKSIYGDQETEDKLNPLLNPLGYLSDPYAREKLTDAERPYPIWGMDVSTGSFFGKFFERTIGQIIKPDVVNPRFGDMVIEHEGGIKFTTGEPGGMTEAESSLIEEGKMLPRVIAESNPVEESLLWSYSAFKDFIGIKGFALSNIESALGIDSDPLAKSELARSGEMENFAREIKDANLGGMGPFGEFQRRFVPTNSGQIKERFNPMKNLMPSWLPSDNESYYIDFSTGDPYNKIERGEARLPGRGYEALHRELEGLNPEDYPDIYKYKILADVALGSDEYYKYKRLMDYQYRKGLLDDSEFKIYQQVVEQEEKRSNRKDFYERKNEADLEQLGSVKGFLARYWETLAHSEMPYEKLSIIRPQAKLVHQRTAIEDYEQTQIIGGEAGMWDQPYGDFIKPFFNEIRREFDEEFIPEETQNRYAIEEYFDKLEYVKQRKLYKEAILNGDREAAKEAEKGFERTIQGASASGLDERLEVVRGFVAMPRSQRDYFSAFLFAEEEDREKISSMLPKNIKGFYESLWDRTDAIQAAYSPSDGSIIQAQAEQNVKAVMEREEDQLREKYPKQYQEYINNDKLKREGTFRQFVADQEAEAYIESTTGMPSEDFSGWDPRIDLKYIKLRTLSIGKEDLYDYGIFQSDEQDIKRIMAVLEEEQIVDKIEKMKNKIKDRRELESKIEKLLEDSGIDPSMIYVTEALPGKNSIDLKLENE